MELSYRWETVFERQNQEYRFSQKISNYMKRVYRNLLCIVGMCLNINKAEELCPQRVNGYLNLGPSQQTNERIKLNFKII